MQQNTTTFIKESLHWRYATKQFDSTKKVTPEEFQQIKDAMRLAPSSSGLQPWKFVVVENPAVRVKLREAAYGQSQITDASHLVVFCRRTDLNEAFVDSYMASTAHARSIKIADLAGYKEMCMGIINGKSETELATWASRQLYIALGFALETAALLKVDACPMEGLSTEKFDEILGLKERQLATVGVLALGYRHPDDKYATAPKSRFSEEEVFITV